MKKLIRIGTRGSKLALWQANHVADLLKKAGQQTEIVVIDTKGDQILDVAISKIGSKGVFTQELEDQLEDGRIEIAVHSAKDMQSQLPDGFELIAFTEREKANDVMLSPDKSLSLKQDGRSLLLGTSSNRRIATLKHFYPHAKTIDIRGNLQTRIRKMEEGHCDALLLAYAGVHRMEYDHMIVEDLSLDEFTPAVGQGSIAVEIADNLDAELKAIVKEACNHPETSIILRAERAYLRVLEGGCSIPVFALGTLEEDQLSLSGGIVSLDGKERIAFVVKGDSNEPEALGEQLAEKVLAAGGDKILEEIKRTLNK